MLKRIPVDQLQLGMYIQSLEGSWLSHPFWKTHFLLSEPSDLQSLRQSGVPAVQIDTSKGADVAPAPVAKPSAPAVELAPPVQPALPAAPQGHVSLDEELERATELMGRSRELVGSLFDQARLGLAVDSTRCLPVVEEVAASIARNPSALISLVRLKSRDDYTYMHSVAVCALMVALARQIGLDDAAVREAGLAGLLHDVGKMMMPTDVLNKPGPLSDAEFCVMRTHPERGHRALLEGGAVLPDAVLDVCLHHHEKIDGSGYPAQLKGEQISLLARMGAICDVYDAITSMRSYKDAWAPADSLHRMAQWTGHFDPQLFKAFVKSIGIYPVGSLVRLQSGRLAVVVDQSPAHLLAPTVRVFYSALDKAPLPLQRIDLAAPDCTDKITGRESAEDWGFDSVEQYWLQPDLQANH